MCHGPRAALGLPEVRLEAGFPADITIVDPEARVEVTRRVVRLASRATRRSSGSSLLGKASDVLVGG